MSSPLAEINLIVNAQNSTALIPLDFGSARSSSISSTNTFNYEVILPIVFVLAFMLVLFLVYIMNNLECRNYIRRVCCHLYKRKRRKPYPIVHPLRNSIHGGKRGPNTEPHYAPKMNMNNYGQPNIELNGKNYYEEASTGFYRLQNPYEPNNHQYFAHMAYKNATNPHYNNNSNNNYDQMYQLEQQQTTAVINMQGVKLNRMYQSEEKSIDYVQQDGPNLGVEQSAMRNKFSKSTEIECEHHVENLASRRSYSHSKLDYQKWQRALTKRQTYNRIDNWPSKVLSECELKKFLAQSSNAIGKNRVALDKRGSLSVLHHPQALV